MSRSINPVVSAVIDIIAMSEETEKRNSILAAICDEVGEIEKRKADVLEKVQAKIGRLGKETKRLAKVRRELDALHDGPTSKKLAKTQMRLGLLTSELEPLVLTCHKKGKEYSEALVAFGDKYREGNQLAAEFVEFHTQERKMKLKKLDELSKKIDSPR